MINRDMEENTDKQHDTTEDGVKDGVSLSAEDHIKIIDKESGNVLLDKRG